MNHGACGGPWPNTALQYNAESTHTDPSRTLVMTFQSHHKDTLVVTKHVALLFRNVSARFFAAGNDTFKEIRGLNNAWSALTDARVESGYKVFCAPPMCTIDGTHWERAGVSPSLRHVFQATFG
eukprot:gene12399-biopygen4936